MAGLSIFFRRRTRLAAISMLAVILGGLLGVACKPRILTPAQRGEVLYRTNCASCHGGNPAMAGPIGPAIAGSSEALIEDRVLHRAYPPGYHPQRKTHLMLPMPWLAGHIGDLAAYLNASAGDPAK